MSNLNTQVGKHSVVVLLELLYDVWNRENGRRVETLLEMKKYFASHLATKSMFSEYQSFW